MNEVKQQQEQPLNRKKKPNWLVIIIVTAVVGGIVQIVVNHFDAIVIIIETRFTQVDWSAILPLILQYGISVVVTIFFVMVLFGRPRAFFEWLRRKYQINYPPNPEKEKKLLKKSVMNLIKPIRKIRAQQVRQLSLWNDLDEN